MEKKADLKTMTWKQRIGFVWDYYRLVILAVVAVIILIGMTVYHYMTTKEDISQIVLVNAKSMPADEEPDFSEFMEQYGYDTAAQEVVVNDAYYVDLTSTDTSNLYSYQSLQTVIAGGGVDVLGADEMVFENLAQSGAIADLTQYFSKDELEQLKDYIFYVEDKDTGDTFLQQASVLEPEAGRLNTVIMKRNVFLVLPLAPNIRKQRSRCSVICWKNPI